MSHSNRDSHRETDGHRRCVNCDRPLTQINGLWLCRSCNSEDFSSPSVFASAADTDEYIFIECPGATLYAPGSNEVVAGVKWRDNNDPTAGFEIVKHPVYAPNHTKRRRIKRASLGRIRRCQACQDFTVRMRRKEGPDFFIPSPKHPGRTRLKPVEYTTRTPSP